MRRRLCPSWTKPYLENEAGKVWLNDHENPTPTNKGSICKELYMKIKALCNNLGREKWTKCIHGNEKRAVG